MAVAMIGPKFYAWDRNGKPLAFGKLYTYQARTNIPKATYQSEDKVVENTNPVILNGEGYANVYLSGSYKMVLKDDDENEIWTSDPVSESNPSEWTNCLFAEYQTATQFRVLGNFTEQYSIGRRVRLSQGGSSYDYGSIKSSSFAGGYTVVELRESIVTVSLTESCTSIVGFESVDYVLTGLVFDTVSSMQNAVLSEGMTVKILERQGASFVVKSGTSDGYAKLGASQAGLIAEIVPQGAMDAREFGAIGDDSFNNTPVAESAKDYCSVLLFPSPSSEVYRFSGAPTIGNMTCLFDNSAALSNVTFTQVNGVVVNQGVMSGHVAVEELKGRQIEVVAGTLRQDSTTRTEWNWIKDSAHEPVGVDDSGPAIASGAKITVNFLKNYSRVISLLCGPDEDFGNALGMTVGASVGTSLIEIKASIDWTLGAKIYYQGAGNWGIDVGAGQGGGGDFNVEVTEITHDDLTGITSITHDCLPGYDIAVSPWSESAALAGGVPYLPVVKDTPKSYQATPYVTELKWIDLSTGAYVLTKNAPMSCVLAKNFRGGAFMDGTNGSDAFDFDKGNIWFYGIFEV